MTKEHNLRAALVGLTGRQREERKLYLLKHPSLIETIAKRKRLQGIQPHLKDTARKRVIGWQMRLTPEEYLLLRDRAAKRGLTMAAYVGQRLLTVEEK
jgi:hypothetical protein